MVVEVGYQFRMVVEVGPDDYSLHQQKSYQIKSVNIPEDSWEWIWLSWSGACHAHEAGDEKDGNLAEMHIDLTT